MSRSTPLRLAALALTTVSLLVAGCGETGSSGSNSGGVGKGSLTGAGSTFVAPFFDKAFYQYTAMHSQVTVNYQPVGSGAGIKQFQAGLVDFGASDVPMGASDIAAAGGSGSLIQIPDTVGAVAIAYNLPSVKTLKLTGSVIADIYLGKVKKWNDPAIAALNSGVSLPSTAITVAHRSDGSGTSYIFTDYLSKVSPTWASQVGKGKSVAWPTGVGGKGNQAVGTIVKQTTGAIGYVELAYVVQAGIQAALVQNKDGQWVKASADGAAAAASQAGTVSPTNFSIVDEPGSTSYPIAGFSWVFLHTSISDKNKGTALVKLFDWLVTSGQQYSASLEYAKLPSSATDYAVKELKTVKVAGSHVL